MGMEKVTEVGIVVSNLDKATRLYTDILGAKVIETGIVDEYHMRYSMCRIGDIDFELMEPTSDTGPIGKFLKNHGEGLHHIGFKVKNIGDSLKEMKEKNIQLIDENPRTDLHPNFKLAFVHPKSFHGVMFELMEYLT